VILFTVYTRILSRSQLDGQQSKGFVTTDWLPVDSPLILVACTPRSWYSLLMLLLLVLLMLLLCLQVDSGDQTSHRVRNAIPVLIDKQ